MTVLLRLAVIVPLACYCLAGEGQADGIARAELKSGFAMMGPDTQAMQSEDGNNPAMLWVKEGEKLWALPPASGQPACSGCHGPAETSMKGVSARYPLFDQVQGRPLDFAGRLQLCRTQHQNEPAWPRESRPLLALTAYLGLQSRGAIISQSDDSRLASFRQAGEKLFTQRQGQLNLSCAACHDDNWGRHLGSSVIPQGHANGYPIYRLEWQNVGSIQRRLRNCLTGMRAELYAYGDTELINLELFLKERAAGLVVETPAVRP